MKAFLTSSEFAKMGILGNLPVGTELQGGTSSVTEHKKKGDEVTGVVVTQKATNSTVSVSARMIAKTIDRLRAGEYLGKRSISGTTTVEATVVAACALTMTEGRYTS